ncbi:hypothetical protein NP493_226g04035 [Ridgeia piscesae]|uniref:Transmembrane protein n=1 Tax=Ridgeia piscesae TaxID=27915 RepID=A0AAD9P040_RIDPI|nr:hypothetical protein NP493_226g04035 [Ridgeia piscesae]
MSASYFQHLSSSGRRRLSDMYEPPNVPRTPSASINSMLNTYCAGPDEYLLKAVAKHGICSIFSTINYVYEAIHGDAEHPSLVMWTASCLIACIIVIAVVYVLYAFAFFSGLFLHKIFLYTAVLTSIVAVIVGIVAILFFESLDRLYRQGNIGDAAAEMSKGHSFHDIARPALLLTSTAAFALQGALQHRIREASVLCCMAISFS